MNDRRRIATLRAGGEVISVGDDAEDLDQLLLAIATVSQRSLDPNALPNWKSMFAAWRHEIALEVDHVAATMDEDPARTMLRELLEAAVLAKVEGVLEDTFPGFGASPN